MGLEGLVSKHQERAYRAGRAEHWVKVKNPTHPALGGEGGEGLPTTLALLIVSDNLDQDDFDLVCVSYWDSRGCVEAQALSSFKHPTLTPFVFQKQDLIMSPWPTPEQLEAEGLTLNRLSPVRSRARSPAGHADAETEA